MQKMICELCGGNEFVKDGDFFVCQSCGTKYTLEDARILLKGSIDVSGSTVKIDSTSELENLYTVARRAKNDGNTETAAKYYDMILAKDPSSWEASFYSTYYQSMNCKIGEIGLAAIRVSNCEESVLNLIYDSVLSEEELKKAVNEVATQSILIADMLFNAYKDYYDSIDYQIQSNYIQDYANNCAACRNILYVCGDKIVEIFGDKFGDIAAECWKIGIKQHNILNGVFNDKKGNADVIKSYNEKISKYDSSYQAPITNMQSDGCYIATCVYGSYDCPQVWVLRRFRDYTLDETWRGRLFIKCYYAISPTLVKWFGKTTWFKHSWKFFLDRFVNHLKENGTEDTPYRDKY